MEAWLKGFFLGFEGKTTMNDDATEKRDQKKAQKKTDSTILGEKMGLFFSFSGSLNGDRNSHV